MPDEPIIAPGGENVEAVAFHASNMMTRAGLPFDHDLYPHISISDYRAGMETQADDGWSIHFEPWWIMTVQQAADGRLFVDDKNGKPVFLGDLSEEQGGPPGHDFAWGLFYVPLGEATERLFAISGDELAMVDADGKPIMQPQIPKQTDH
jgi:hypothetical protein